VIAAQIERKMVGDRADWRAADVEITSRLAKAGSRWTATWPGICNG
jgi:hypothetical protein